jgi:hypothetical protein
MLSMTSRPTPAAEAIPSPQPTMECATVRAPAGVTLPVIASSFWGS